MVLKLGWKTSAWFGDRGALARTIRTIVIGASASMAKGADGMSVETNKALVRRETEAWNTGDTSWLTEFVASTFRGSHPDFPDGMTGLDDYMTWYETIHPAFPDMHATIDELVAEGDAVVVRGTFVGTNAGPKPAPEIGVTGKPVSIMYVDIEHIVDGKLVAMWYAVDRYEVLQQMGVVPPLGASQPATVV
jgi:predicted ester cyclase